MCPAMPFSSRALILTEMWFIVVCIDHEYASLHFSQTFLLLVSECLASLQKFFKGNSERVHFQARVGVFNCQQILTKSSFVIFDIVVKKKQIKCGLAW